MRRRIVISGVGTVTGLGIGAPALWEGLLAGRSAVGPITRFDASGFRCRVGAELKDFSAKDYVPKSYRKAVRVMARDSELAVAAAKAAVEDAGLTTRAGLPEGVTEGTTYAAGRLGCQIGAGLIAADAEELAAALDTARAPDGSFSIRAWGGSGDGAATGGMENLTPLWLLKYLPNMLACHVTIIHGAEGPSNTITCAEASGLLSIGESMRVIERGSADVCFSGGAESKLNYMGLLRIELAGRLAATEDAAAGAGVVRPFAPDAAGSVLGEGGGILMLEEMASAQRRNARAYAELTGFGAGHSSLWEMGDGADEGYCAAVEAALHDAGITADAIDAVVPLGAGIAAADRVELASLRAVLGARLESLPLVTICPAVGNCMAGAGGVQAAVGALCVREQALPASLVGGRMRRAGGTAALRNVLVCSGALGGQNAAVVMSRIAS